MLKEICLATTNKRKLQELKVVLAHLPINLRSLCDYKDTDDEPVENGKSFTENTIIQANYYYDLIKTPVLADDSGLCVPSLRGKPQVYFQKDGLIMVRIIKSDCLRQWYHNRRKWNIMSNF